MKKKERKRDRGKKEDDGSIFKTDKRLSDRNDNTTIQPPPFPSRRRRHRRFFFPLYRILCLLYALLV